MTSDDRRQFAEILTRLAVATREKIERQTLEVYIDALQKWSPETLKRACAQLQTSSAWFPKVAEISEACNSVRMRDLEARHAMYLPSHLEPASADRLELFKQQIRDEIQRRSMPDPNTPIRRVAVGQKSK